MAKSKYYLIFILILLTSQLLAYSIPTIVTNKRIIFGLAGSNNIALAISSTALLISTYAAVKYRRARFPLVLTASGMVSNIFDRVLFGGVRDYIKLPWWPAFNLADLAIIAGIILLTTTIITPITRPAT